MMILIRTTCVSIANRSETMRSLLGSIALHQPQLQLERPVGLGERLDVFRQPTHPHLLGLEQGSHVSDVLLQTLG